MKKLTFIGWAIILNLFLIILLLFSPVTKADSVYVGMWSKHYQELHDCAKNSRCSATVKANANHDLLMYEHNSYEIGTFKNSFGDRTYLVAKIITSENAKIGDIQIALHAGIVRGYHGCYEGKVYQTTVSNCFYAVAEAAYTKYDIQPALLLFPGGAAITFKYKID
jgi:hypothetical protein